jgi:hypothetical protein
MKALALLRTVLHRAAGPTRHAAYSSVSLGGELMNRTWTRVLATGIVAVAVGSTHAQNLLTNGNLDLTQATVIVDNPDPTADFFLPKPQAWQNIGTRAITGPYEDEMSSEPWAGPAPTPVTTDGNSNPPHPEGCGGPDCAVFFKAFSGNATDGAATGHLQQAVPGLPGKRYELRGWAGAEPNFLGEGRFAIDFLNSGGNPISSVELSLNAAGLLTDNGQPFDYKQFIVAGISPAGTTSVRARASMLNGMPNPAGGGQAFVVDDFSLQQIPEPTSLMISMIALIGSLGLVRRR